ncbi:MAG TPA: excinuclease ABC subunit UvrA, partial [Chlamydiales bacterium]|nr:excinuclease ABC subunit UvrA [Chlamydiales bacterium]
MNNPIILKKVTVHNLKGVDLTIEPGQLVVFTGVSGSGKSSLAFDTIYVEGQRRYIESLPAKPGHMVKLAKPEAEKISGIAPTIAIEQKLAARTPRSTVGTLTGIYDFLRVLFAKLSTPYCPISKEPVSTQAREKIIRQIQKLPEGKRMILLAPYAKGKKGEFIDDFKELLSKGFTRLRVDGEWVDLTEEVRLDGKVAHNIEIVIDRCKIEEEAASRIAESVQLALEMGKGVCITHLVETKEEEIFSEIAFSAKSGLSYPPLFPHDFSFNHPIGMCPTCQGLKVISTEEKKEKGCPVCKGAGIKPYPAAARLGGKTIQEITNLPLDQLLFFFQNLPLTPLEKEIGEELIKEIEEELHFLLHVGLSYLSLDRISPSLSGGESQRVRLAAQIGAGLVGAIYILDEPSIGLHASDHHRLIETLFHLRDQGNTVLVVEHDVDTMRAADLIVDVGPGAGKEGGEILTVGKIEEVMKNPRSLTGQYLSGKKKIEIPKKRRKPTSFLKIVGAAHHNLKNLTVDIPLKVLTCVTGVSGSGKSSLISEILYPALSNHLHNAKLPVGKHKEIIGLDLVDKIIAVDQSPIGRTPRSNAATYIKLFDEIRDLYAQLQEARIRGFTPGHFSFNVKEGTCPYCQGLGTVSIDLDFLESASVTCPQCQGARFDPEILTIRFKGKNIADLLDTDVDEALAIFSEIPPIREKLQMLHEVGLGYLKLGQPSTTLSGGEAQRIKLAKELVRPPSGNTLYLFDEPTTGLHFEDIRRLIAILQKLVDRGNTVLIIEHNLDLIQTADWLIDLGPKAGIYGGELLGSLPPEKMAKLDTPTGRVLRGEKAALSHPLRKKKGSDVISIENGTQNNLKSVSLKIPRGKISLFTGPSGSGKSSLAFDTLYAEGQRRYTETLPPYMRSMIHQLPKPKVDRIDGLAPSIALEQKRGGLNPRSTVGTMTEIYDLLRLLYANLGDPFCPETGEPIQEISKGFVVSKLMSLSQEKIAILSPISLEKKESLEEFTERLNAQGFLRIRLDGTIYALDEKIPFEKGRKQELLLVIDRLILDPKNRERLYEAIDKAAKLSQGIVIIARERQEDLFFNLKFAVEKTGKSYPPITPQTFSFNHEEGMCLECQGLGSIYGFPWMTNPKVMSLSLMDLCIHLFGEKGTTKVLKIFATYWEECGLDLHAPLEQLSPKELDWIFHGAPEQEIKKCVTLKWMGLNPLFASIARMGKKEVKEHLLPLMTTSPCPNCKGARLNPLARHVTLNGTTLPALCAQELDTLLPFFQKLNLEKAPFLQETHAQICKTVELLLSLGLSYLSLDRSAPTLSGGELQRIRLAKQLGTGLTSCLYVLDEPTIGLHPFNNEQLNVALKALASLNNTLLLVEHDPMTIQIADQIFDFGPKAGKEGGRIIAQG